MQLTDNFNRPKHKMAIVYFVLVELLIFVASYYENVQLYTLFMVGFTLLSIFIDPILPICINICSSPIALEMNAMITVAINVIAVSVAFFEHTLILKRGMIAIQDFLFILGAALGILLSIVFGQNAAVHTGLLQLILLLWYLVSTRIYVRKNNYLLLVAFILAGVFMLINILIQMATDSTTLLWGYRLSYNGSVRTLSSALAVPIYYLCTKLLLPQKKSISFALKILIFLALVVMSYILILTYSRGVMISLLIAIFYLLISQIKKMTYGRMGFYILFLGVSTYLLMQMEIDSELMLSGLSSGSGRIDIWRFFFERIKTRGFVGYLVGFGPGDINRITFGTIMSGAYAHSTLFDYIFSYGIIGAFILGYLIVRSFVIARKSQDPRIMGLLILTIALYSTHGNSANYAFHLLLGLVYSLSAEQIQSKRANNELTESQKVYTIRKGCYEKTGNDCGVDAVEDL